MISKNRRYVVKCSNCGKQSVIEADMFDSAVIHCPECSTLVEILSSSPLKGKVFRHNKSGNLYEVIANGKDASFIDRVLIIYRSLEDGRVWVRSRSEFFQNVNLNGREVPRFEMVG